MLATLPRSKLSDMFWPAVTGVAGAAPGAWDAIRDAYLKPPAEGLSIFGLIEVGFVIFFFTLLLISIASGWSTQTSGELLDEIYPPNAQRQPRRLRIAKWILKC